MATNKFIPKIWSTKILEHLRNELIFGGLVNRDYEGEIRRAGDTVHIFSTDEVTIKDMPARLDCGKIREIEGPEGLCTLDRALLIDQEKYFNFGIDDVDRVQMAVDLLDEYTKSAAYGLQAEMDKYLANLMCSEAELVLGTDESPVQLTSENIFAQIMKLKTALDRANVPQQGRFLVLPPELEGALALDNRFSYIATATGDSTVKNGKVFRAGGFDIAISNNIPYEGNKFKVIASYKGAVTFAEQLLEVESYRVEKGFGEAVKGLAVYGAKVTRPEKVVCMTATFDSADGVVEKKSTSVGRTRTRMTEK